MNWDKLKKEFFDTAPIEIDYRYQFDRINQFQANTIFEWFKNKLKSSKRSTKANKLYWLWMKCLEDETGEPKESYHKYFKQKFIGTKIEKGLKDMDIIIEPSTRNMLSKPFNEYMKKVQAESAIEFNTVVPLPEDEGYDQFLDHYKDYL